MRVSTKEPMVSFCYHRYAINRSMVSRKFCGENSESPIFTADFELLPGF
jgi:hypothetical protein